MSATHQTIQANGTRGLFAYIDKLGLVIAAIALSGLLLPFANFRANRIVQGEPRYLLDALPASLALLFAAVVATGLLIGFVRSNNLLRLFAALFCLASVMLAIGLAASYLSPEGNRYARVSPASGFWLLFLRAHFMSRMGWSGCVPVRFTGRTAGHCRIAPGRAAFLRPLGQHLIHEGISKPRGQLLERSGAAYIVGIGIACSGDRSGYSAGACLPSLGRVAGFRS